VKIGKLVELAINLFEDGEPEAALMLACVAVDGTGKKAYPDLEDKSKARFVKLIREAAGVFGPMGLPGWNVLDSRFAVTVVNPRAPKVEIEGQWYQLPDAAEVLYGIHRCSLGHGDELPDGFELIPDVGGFPGLTRMTMAAGRVQFSDRVIFALLSVAVLSPANRDQKLPDTSYLTLVGIQFSINDWWGRYEDFYEGFAKNWASRPTKYLPKEEWIQEAGFLPVPPPTEA
jgi:hypothetical protein